MKKTLHIIIYSELLPYGGGRETWLQYFVPGIIPYFNTVNIYALESKKDRNLVSLFPFTCNTFYYGKISRKEYIEFVKEKLTEQIHDYDICLMIGSIVEGSISSWLKKKYPHVQKIIWIRSIAAHEVADRHNKYLYPIISLMEKKNLYSADLIITNGYDTQKYYTKQIKRRTIHCIPNAVDIPKYRTQRSWNHEIASFLFLGRFERIKGANLLIDAVNQFNLRYPEKKRYVKFDVWGEGGYKQNGIPDNLLFHGKAQRNDVPDIISKSDFAFLLINNNDKGSGGLSHSLLEFMACGCIPIASNQPCYRQILHDKNAIIVYSQATDALTDLIAGIADDFSKKKTEKYATISKETVNSAAGFSVEEHIRKFIQLVNGEGLDRNRA